jgi:hypothetical protein
MGNLNDKNFNPKNGKSIRYSKYEPSSSLFGEAVLQTTELKGSLNIVDDHWDILKFLAKHQQETIIFEDDPEAAWSSAYRDSSPPKRLTVVTHTPKDPLTTRSTPFSPSLTVSPYIMIQTCKVLKWLTSVSLSASADSKLMVSSTAPNKPHDSVLVFPSYVAITSKGIDVALLIFPHLFTGDTHTNDTHTNSPEE